MTMTVYPVRGVLLVGASGGAAWWLADIARALLAPAATLESLVTAAVLAGGAAAAAVMSLTSAVAVTQSLLGRQPRAAQSLPLPLRRFLVGTVAAAVATGAGIPAHADESYPGWAPTVPTASEVPAPSVTPSVSPDPVPTYGVPTPTPSIASPPPSPAPSGDPGEEDAVVELHAESWAPALTEPASGRPTSGATAGAAAGHSRVTHVVVPGESLWSITRDALASGASDAAIAAAWPLIYAANHDLIGPEPGLILPGQELVIPAEVAP